MATHWKFIIINIAPYISGGLGSFLKKIAMRNYVVYVSHMGLFDRARKFDVT